MKTTTWVMAAVGGFLLCAAYGFGVSPSLEAGQTYRADLAGLPGARALQSGAQALGWWVRVQTEAEVAYFRGMTACEACDPLHESAFLELPQLIVDGALFQVRLETDAFRLNLRPKSSAGGLYELVVVMRETMDAQAARGQIAEELTPLGLHLPPAVGFEAVPLADKAKSAVPDGAPLDEILYRLTLAPDWPDYARLQGISLSGLRARTVLTLAEGAALPAGFSLVVEQAGEQRVRAQALIPDLLALARTPQVLAVERPLEPQPGRAD